MFKVPVLVYFAVMLHLVLLDVKACSVLKCICSHLSFFVPFPLIIPPHRPPLSLSSLLQFSPVTSGVWMAAAVQRTRAPARRATQATTVDSVSEICDTPGCQCVGHLLEYIVKRTKCLPKDTQGDGNYATCPLFEELTIQTYTYFTLYIWNS